MELVPRVASIQGSVVMPCRVVLVEPRDARNVGMAARACANFGVSDFFVVHSDKFKASIIRAEKSAAKATQLGLSVGVDGVLEKASSCSLDLPAWKGCERLATNEGAELLRSARLCGELQAALSGTQRSVAFSGRDGRNFRHPSVSLPALAGRIARGSVHANGSAIPHGGAIALVFGSEDVGLSTESVLLCDDVCRLRTGVCPSLNLSHCVAVVLARIFEDISECSGGNDGQAAAANSQSPVERQRFSGPVCPIGGAPTDADGKNFDSSCAAEAPTAESTVASAWAGHFAELCRQRLEARGYPVQPDLWHGRGRRRCKFTYRLFRLVADCGRTLQRAHLTEDESNAWQRLVEALSNTDKVGVNRADFPSAVADAIVEGRADEGPVESQPARAS